MFSKSCLESFSTSNEKKKKIEKKKFQKFFKNDSKFFKSYYQRSVEKALKVNKITYLLVINALYTPLRDDIHRRKTIFPRLRLGKYLSSSGEYHPSSGV